MASDPKKTTLIFAAVIGGISGGIAGAIGDSFFNGVVTGVITGSVVALFFLNQPRNPEGPRVAIEALSPAGSIGAITASVLTNGGWVGAIISSGIGWALGLFLPAILVALLINDEK